MASDTPPDWSNSEHTARSAEISSGVREAAEHALAHADDLLAAARLLLDCFPHLAYHFGALALEEIGRCTLLELQDIAGSTGSGSGRLMRDIEDHERKLFWALWGPSFGRELITAAQIEEFRGLARAIHETRKAGLYYGGVDARPPSEAVTLEETRILLDLVTARLGMARATTWAEPDSEQAEDLRWFIEATQDEEKRSLIMGGSSMEKLVVGAG